MTFDATQARIYPRSAYEAALDVRYGCVLNRLNERLYNRIDALFGGVGLIGGSAAFAGVIAANSTLAAGAGLVLAALSIMDARLAGLSLEQTDAELIRLRAMFPDGIEGLALVAYNKNLLSNGRTDALAQLPLWSRVLSAVS
jgi:hypothetical protein